MGNGVEFRIMPNGEDGHWYWEVIKDGREVVARGVTERSPLPVNRRMKRREKWS
jgi:hypothetical protein